MHGMSDEVDGYFKLAKVEGGKELPVFWLSNNVSVRHETSFYVDGVFVSEDTSRQGKLYCGLPVCSPTILRELAEPYFVIIYANDYGRIKNKLLQYGLHEYENFISATQLMDQVDKKHLAVSSLNLGLMTSSVAVSVIVPVYNTERYLRKCINSICESTLRNIEIICVDDGSSDGSVSIINEYCQRDKRIRLIKQSNQYAGAARNNGMKHASGEYLAFIDSDDFIERDALEKLYNVSKKYELDVLKCSSYLYDNITSETSTNKWSVNFWAIQKIGYNRVCRFDEKFFDLCRVADAPWTGLYRTKFIRENKILFPEFFCCNDRYFSIKCVIEAKRMMVTNIFMNNYRQNISGSLIDKKKDHFDCQIKNYRAVSKGVGHLPRNLFCRLMQVELEQLFYHYATVVKKSDDISRINEIMIEFIDSFNVEDVGKKYFIENRFKEKFQKIKDEL